MSGLMHPSFWGIRKRSTAQLKGLLDFNLDCRVDLMSYDKVVDEMDRFVGAHRELWNRIGS